MGLDEKDSRKTERILDIYTQLSEGRVVRKPDIAEKYQVNVKTIQRDLEDVRHFLDNRFVENGFQNDLIYDYKEKGYRFEHVNRMKFTNDEVLAICKILLDSRAFTKPEMMSLLDKLLDCCVPKDNQKVVNDLIANEKFHYIPPHHNTVFLDKMWTLGQAIKEARYIEFMYKGVRDTKPKHRKLSPLAITFSEYYFYLVGILAGSEDKFIASRSMSPTIFRIDRIIEITVTKEHFKIPYKSRFEEGEFRKRTQFMTGGELRRIKFQYTGLSVEAVLDRIPTAQILSEEDGRYTIQAEVFGDGIDMWIKSQGDYVKLI